MVESCFQGLIRHIYRNEFVYIYIIIDSEKKFCLPLNLCHYLLHTHVFHLDGNLLRLCLHLGNGDADGSKNEKTRQANLLNNLFIHTFVEFGSMVGNRLIFLVELYADEC